MNNVRKLTYTALLTAWVILIPIYFKFLQIVIPPFSATLTAHVPIFLSMLLGPEAAVMVGLGSALGFFISLGPVVAARALMHVIVGVTGALLIKKGISFGKVLIIVAPLHAVLEALVVIPFGFSLYKALVLVGVGSLIHHSADAVIAVVLVKALSRSLRYDLTKGLIK